MKYYINKCQLRPSTPVHYFIVNSEDKELETYLQFDLDKYIEVNEEYYNKIIKLQESKDFVLKQMAIAMIRTKWNELINTKPIIK